jgi:hypothetical protein
VLIAGELTIDVPQISFDELDNFLLKTAPMHNSTNMSAEEKMYTIRNNRIYPWERRVLEFEGRTFHNYRENKPFTELSDIIDSLPIKASSRVVTLLLQKEQGTYDFNWHFDRDTLGFRICLGLDTTKSFLEFAKLKEEYNEYNRNLKRIEPYMVDETIFSITPTRTNTVLCVTGEKYPHRVPLINATQRCSLIVRGELTDTNFDLCQRIDDEFYIQ